MAPIRPAVELYAYRPRGPRMDRVSTEEGVRYGMNIFAYVIGVGLVAFFVILVGATMARPSPLLGVIVIFAGVIIAMAGLSGLLYKVIADGVAAGQTIYHAGDGELADDSEPDLMGPDDDPFAESDAS